MSTQEYETISLLNVTKSTMSIKEYEICSVLNGTKTTMHFRLPDFDSSSHELTEEKIAGIVFEDKEITILWRFFYVQLRIFDESSDIHEFKILNFQGKLILRRRASFQHWLDSVVSIGDFQISRYLPVPCQ